MNFSELGMSFDPSKDLFDQQYLSLIQTLAPGATDLRVTSGDQQVLERIRASNTQENIAKIFFGPLNLHLTYGNDRDIIGLQKDEQTFTRLKEQEENRIKAWNEQKKRVSNGWLIGANYPTAAYSAGALMMVAGETSRLFEPTAHACSIFEAPPKVQTEYWSQALSILKKALDLIDNPVEGLPDLSKVVPMMVEHHGREVKSPQHNALRTLALDHGHLVFPNFSHLKPHSWNTGDFRLPQEEKLLLRHQRNRSPNMRDNLVEPLNTYFGIDSFVLRTGKPVGYQTNVSIEDPSKVAEFMYKHYLQFSLHAQEMEAEIRERLMFSPHGYRFLLQHIVQPTYGMILIPHNHEEATFIVNATLADVGPIERSKLKLERQANNPPLWNETETQRFHEELLKGL